MHYPRIVLKLSGEVLKPANNLGIAQAQLNHYTTEIAAAHATGTQLAIVIGGGNFWRGHQAQGTQIQPAQAHAIGMLATVMNTLALRDALTQHGLPTLAMSHLPVPTLCPTYNAHQAIQALHNNTIVLLGGGLGTPFFSTDTAAIATALSLQANIVLKGTKVEGIYPADPAQVKAQTHYTDLPLSEVHRQNLRVMDMTAITLAQEHACPIIVYNAQQKGYLARILQGEKIGTTLS